MRAILIDWLVEVHLKFKVRPTYCALCVLFVQQCGRLCLNLVSMLTEVPNL